MPGLLNLFLDDNNLLASNGHSRRTIGQGGSEAFVAYNTVGAAQILHLQVSDPLPYYFGEGGPVLDGEFGNSQAAPGLYS